SIALDLLCVAGFDGYFKRLNPAWERTLGYSTDELLAQPYLDFIHPGDRSSTVHAINRVRAGINPTTFRNRYRHKDGTYRELEWTAAPHPTESMVYAAAKEVAGQDGGMETAAQPAQDLAAALQAQ